LNEHSIALAAQSLSLPIPTRYEKQAHHIDTAPIRDPGHGFVRESAANDIGLLYRTGNRYPGRHAANHNEPGKLADKLTAIPDRSVTLRRRCDSFEDRELGTTS
jgi:hypothetical protein